MSSIAVLVPAFLHALPKRYHLAADFDIAFGSGFTLAGMSGQKETLLLLFDDLLLLRILIFGAADLQDCRT